MASTTELPTAPAALPQPATTRRRPTKLGRSRPNFLGGLGGWIWLAIIIVPVYYVVITSLKNQAGFFTSNPMLATCRANAWTTTSLSWRTTSPSTSPTA